MPSRNLSHYLQLGAIATTVPLLLGATQTDKVNSIDLWLGGGAIAVGIVLHLLSGRLWTIAKSKLEPLLGYKDGVEPENKSPILNFLLHYSLLLGRIGLWVSIALYLAYIFPESRVWSDRIANTLRISLTSPLFSLGRTSYSLVNIFLLGLSILATIVLAGILTNILRGKVLSALAIGRGTQEAIATIIKYTAISLGSIIVLQVWGVDLTSLTIVASALSVGVGFGLQDIAKNFGSGLVLIFERPIQVGDFVEVGKYIGTVERIGSRSTLIKTLDKVSVVVPNSRFLENEIVNWSHQGGLCRLHIPVGVAYESDVAIVRKALIEAVEGVSGVVNSPSPQVFFKNFGDSAINFELLVWTNVPTQQFAIKSNLYFKIESIFKKYDIQIPFPQQDLHFRSGSLPLEISPELEEILKNVSDGMAGNHTDTKM